QQFLPDIRTHQVTLDLDLDLAFDQHQELVHVVHEIAPDLPRWIDPVLEAEATARPVGANDRQLVLEVLLHHLPASGRLRTIVSSSAYAFSRSESGLRRNAGSALHMISRSLGSCCNRSFLTSSRCRRIAPSYLPMFRV